LSSARTVALAFVPLELTALITYNIPYTIIIRIDRSLLSSARTVALAFAPLELSALITYNITRSEQN
jgi:hypothetical protein